MNRILWTGLVGMAVLTLPVAVGAQVEVGPMAGLTFSTLAGDDIDSETVDTRTGFFVGGSVGVPLSGILGFGTGLYYVEKGAKQGLVDGSLDLGYLEIPLLLQVRATGPERPVAVSLFLGPALAFNISCDASLSEGPITASGDCSDDVTSFELGALFGAGASFPAGERATVTVNGGLDLGLTSIDDTPDEDDVKNRAYFLGVGVSWPLGG